MTKAEAARQNGRKSRGPKTPRGRAASSKNAITHGLTAKTLILQNEDPRAFRQMHQAYLDLLKPANPLETAVVAELVAARWRLRRVWSYQTATLDMQMDAQASDFEKRPNTRDQDTRGALAFNACVESQPGFNTAFRYEVHLSRIYRRILEKFMQGAKRTQEVVEKKPFSHI